MIETVLQRPLASAALKSGDKFEELTTEDNKYIQGNV